MSANVKVSLCWSGRKGFSDIVLLTVWEASNLEDTDQIGSRIVFPYYKKRYAITVASIKVTRLQKQGVSVESNIKEFSGYGSL